MVWLRRIVRAVLVTALSLAVLLPALTYVVLSTPWAQDKIRGIAETELTDLLGAKVEIGKIDYRPFNSLAVSGVSVHDPSGRPAMDIARVSARFELFYFLTKGRLLFDYAVVDAPVINLYRPEAGAPLNIQPIIDRLTKKDDNKPPTSFDLKIGTVIIRDGIMKYNVNGTDATPGRFNANHIELTDLNLHAYLRHATNDDIDVSLESLAFKEKSGLEVTDLVADFTMTPQEIRLSGLELDLPQTCLALNPIEVDRKQLGSGALPMLEISSASPAVISAADFKSLSPVLGQLDIKADARFILELKSNTLEIREFQIETDGLSALISGQINGLNKGQKKNASLKINAFKTSGGELATLLGRVERKAPPMLERAGRLELKGDVVADESGARAKLDIGIDNGRIDADLVASTDDSYKNVDFTANITTERIPAGRLLDNPRLGEISLRSDGHGTWRDGKAEFSGEIELLALQWDKREYSNIKVNGSYTPERAIIVMDSRDEDAYFTLDADILHGGRVKSLEANINVERFYPAGLNLPVSRKGLDMKGDISAYFRGSSLNDVVGFISMSDIECNDANGEHFEMQIFQARLDRETARDILTVESDYLNGTVEGDISIGGIMPLFRDMAAHVVPSLFPLRHTSSMDEGANIFTADFTISNVEDLCEFLHLPVAVIYPVDIMASVDSADGIANISIDIPYLRQGDKIIDSTVLGAFVDMADNRMNLYATTHLPTKKGPMTVVLGTTGANSRFDTRIDWEIERAIPLNGIIDFSTLLSRSEKGSVCVNTTFNPGQINFGDDVWNIHPSQIGWCDNVLTVNDFCLTADSQSINIDGRGSASDEDFIDISLGNINLITIFETLQIDKALIGGTANGTFKATRLLSKMPVMTTNDLHVDSISYNGCVIGTAEVKANWDNDKKSVYLDADILNPEGQISRITGDIFPMGESLDLDFNATHVRVGFMQPFMAAFTSEVSGYASGHAHLFGTFKDIDMEGDVYAEDLKVKIDFTNTVYTASDSIHITPGVIELDNVTIRDVHGQTARLSGILTHEFFHLPRFDFKLTDAHNFLCYNVPQSLSPDWFGSIYGSGTATVTGYPGTVNIGADITTAPGTVFTFVLSDRLDAEQYSFITFNDVTELSGSEQLGLVDDTPQAVKDFIERMSRRNIDKPSDYNLDFRVDITPDAEMIIVMDPVGGDRIRAYGVGDMRMTYTSSENDLRMYGSYTLERGSYNFTLQDIIIKDFSMEPGSSITFHGDPYSALLDLEATYQLNANLSDLDESFTMDKDLNRTNVPVQALLIVKGDMRQPEVSFDLRFPTLTSDIYRKVRSIISTDDMMNRQIIYLLALNRFYTPDYMASTTKGNELFSVASSTISSQLSNMLGKLSDKWSIAPNLRSDRGDFSDIEVDVALTSRLLNNRLLLNGNLGYRDKSLNTNQFIGDFDIEYLLTPKGNWRLKGYSRYNDQNYYVRTAPTTQGVGIMFRRDFDSLFSRKKKKTEEPEESASTPESTENTSQETISDEHTESDEKPDSDAANEAEKQGEPKSDAPDEESQSS